MLTTLAATPVRLVSRRRVRPVFKARWITTRPKGRPKQQRWLPAAALDVGVHVPPPAAVVDPRRTLSPADWTAQSLCATSDPANVSDPLFFGIEHRESPGALIAAANDARRMCAVCPVATTCLTEALVNDERYGVWGGTSGRQREKMRTRLAAGATVAELVQEHLPRPARELTA
jgi:hypothetical protein